MELAARLWSRRAEIEAAQGRFLFIGHGNFNTAKSFAANRVPGATVLLDEDLSTYGYLGAVHDLRRFLHPRVPLAYIESMLKMRQITGSGGSLKQNGGVLILVDGVKLAYSHIDQYPGDYPSMDELVNALPAPK